MSGGTPRKEIAHLKGKARSSDMQFLTDVLWQVICHIDIAQLDVVGTFDVNIAIAPPA